MAAQRKRGRPRQEIRDGHKWCRHHKAWEEVEQFDVANASTGALEPSCRVSGMFMRDMARDGDDAHEYFGTDTCIDPDLQAIAVKLVENGATEVVRRLRYLGITVDRTFVMSELNYESLVPEVRAFLGPDGLCKWCGRPFTKKHRISFDHVEPPRWEGFADWERLHASNIQLMHVGENGSKGKKPYATALHDNMQRWMAERDWARHADEKGWPSLEAMRLPAPEPLPECEPAPEVDPQTTIYDFLGT